MLKVSKILKVDVQNSRPILHGWSRVSSVTLDEVYKHVGGYNPILTAIRRVYKGDALWSLLPSCGPFDGGCLICARALIMTFGGDLVRIVSSINGGQTEHYGASINGVIYDFNGAYITPEVWIKHFQQVEIVKAKCSFAKGLDPKSSILDDPKVSEKIAKLLKGVPDTLATTKTAGMQDGVKDTSRKLGPCLSDDPRIKERKMEYIKIFRAVSDGTTEFHDMDYCTLSRSFAEGHADHGAAVDEVLYNVLAVVVPVGWVFEAYNPGEYFFHAPKGTSSKGKIVYTADPVEY